MIIAHGLIGAMAVTAVDPASVRERPVRTLLVGALVGISPDLDFFFEWVLGWHNMHRTMTHSLPFAAALGALLLWRMGSPRRRLALAYTLAFTSHTLLDFVGSRRSPGVAFFWPFWPEHYRLGVVALSEIPTGLGSWNTLQSHLGQLLQFAVIEAALLAPLLLLVYRAMRSATPAGEVDQLR
jgi:membrane-bound metal-dependent hydrolase YbcI (DUF457 family)